MARVVAIATATLAALSLAACALPLPVAIATYVADGVLLAATGKTMGDTAISTAAEQDCAIWRVLKDEPVCRDYAPGEAPTVVARIPDAAEGGEGGVSIPVAVVLGPVPVPDDKPILIADLPPLPRNRPVALDDDAFDTVRLVQSYLTVLGYAAGPVDGIVGPRTRGAVAAYAESSRLPRDSQPDRALLRRITAPHGLPDHVLAGHLADAG
ncbi:MAG: peptidoglycan-binding domain-containing protein [Alphaproteobacteria bacterium]